MSARAAALGRGATHVLFVAGFVVASFAGAGCEAPPDPTSAGARGDLRAAPALPPRSFAFVLVDLGGGVDLAADEARGRLLDDSDSLRQHLLANSYGAQDITGEIFGPLPYAFAAGCDTNGLARGLRAQIPGTFDHYVWYLGTRQDVCGWKGLATVGAAATPSRDTWLDALSSCLVMAQEPEHNFGVQHASSLARPQAPLLDDPNGCTAGEYGDPFDPMGGGCRHMNAWEKEYRGWLSGCNGVNVNFGGTFTLLPLEQRCDGVQFLRVEAARPRTFRRPAGGGGPAGTDALTHYYVELRTPRDFDGTVGNERALVPQVLIHVGANRLAPSQGGAHTYLLDMTPETPTFDDAALAVGQTFVDPAGQLSITTRAVSATSATVEVALHRDTFANTCLDGRSFDAPGPGPASCEPSPDPPEPPADASAASDGSADGSDGDVTDATIAGDVEPDAVSGADADVAEASRDADALPGPTPDGAGAANVPPTPPPKPQTPTASGPPFPTEAGCACATVGEGAVGSPGGLGFVLVLAGVLGFRRWPMRPRR